MVEKVEKISTEEFKKHFENLINCLISIAPSRNRVTQMLFLLPQRKEDLKELYEFFSDEKLLNYLKNLGLEEVGEKIRIKNSRYINYDSFLNGVHWLVTILLRIFNNDTVRNGIKETLGIEVPNLWEEWFKQKLRICLSEQSLGADIKRFLQIMKEKGNVLNWCVKFEEIEKELKDKSNVVRDILVDFGIVDYLSESESYQIVRLSKEAEKFKNVIEEILKE
jgi:CRISPR/Cas system CSM-associated protein Csm2 small subunit